MDWDTDEDRLPSPISYFSNISDRVNSPHFYSLSTFIDQESPSLSTDPSHMDILPDFSDSPIVVRNCKISSSNEHHESPDVSVLKIDSDTEMEVGNNIVNISPSQWMAAHCKQNIFDEDDLDSIDSIESIDSEKTSNTDNTTDKEDHHSHEENDDQPRHRGESLEILDSLSVRMSPSMDDVERKSRKINAGIILDSRSFCDKRDHSVSYENQSIRLCVFQLPECNRTTEEELVFQHKKARKVVLVHGADLGGVVERLSNISRLLGQYHSPSEKLRVHWSTKKSLLQVKRGQISNALTVAGVERFVIYLAKYKCNEKQKFRTWIEQCLHPLMKSL